MEAFKEHFYDQLEHCPSQELSATVRKTKRTLPLTATLTVIMEHIVSRILLMGVYAWRSVTLEKVKCELSSRSYRAFMKLCEVSYKRQQIVGHSSLPQDNPQALVYAVHKEKRLFPFFDSRTICDLYPPAPMSNLFLLASTELECFLSAVHLLDQPIEVIQPFVESVLQNGKNETVLVYFIGLASKHKASAAYKELPRLLEYMWHEITDHDTATDSWRLKVVIRCYCEAKRSSMLTAFKSNAKGYHTKRILNSFSPFGCFLSSTRGQRIVESYISRYIRDPFIHNMSGKRIRVRKYWQVPHQVESHTIQQICAYPHLSEDMRSFGTIVMPSCPTLPITKEFINDYDFDDEGDWSYVSSGRHRNTRGRRSKDVLCCNQSVFYGISSSGVYRIGHSLATENLPSSAGEVESPVVDIPKLVTTKFIIPEGMYPVLTSTQQIPSNLHVVYACH